MNTWTKLAIFLVPALAATWFVLWRFSPEQEVLRHAALIFACAERGTLSPGSAREKAERLQATVAAELEIRAPHPVPSGVMSSSQAGRVLIEFQNGILSCRISRENEKVEFLEPEKAVYLATVSADATQGPGRTYHMRYRCRIEFRRSGRDWLAELIELEAF